MEKSLADQAQMQEKQEKRWDHLVRALHVEEIPFREAEYTAWAPGHRSAWEEWEASRVKKETEDHEHRQATFERFQKLRPDATAFLKKVRESKESRLLKRKTGRKASRKFDVSRRER